MKNQFIPIIIVIFLFTIIAAGCQSVSDDQTPDDITMPEQTKVNTPLPSDGGTEMADELTLYSTVFSEGGDIPVRYTCDGNDISPPLIWTSVPEGTQSIALIADDPDAPVGTWIHWVIYDIPAERNDLPEGISTTERVSEIGTQGVNDFRKLGYGGPCPPPGKPHRYFFKLYALDTLLGLDPGMTKKDLEKTMQGHILAESLLIGKYGR